jgi:hypothetical protein
MESQIILLDAKDLFPLAKGYFLKICGLKLESDKHRLMWERALAVYEKILLEIHPTAIIKKIDSIHLVGKELTIDGIGFICNAFEQIEENNVSHIYPYMLTIGDISLEFESLIDSLYSDIWGTALVDAARDLLHARLKKTDRDSLDKIVLSHSFGPGYYGMDLSQINSFFQLLDAGKIGLCCTEDCYLIPQKSCTGMYLAVRDEEELPPLDCSTCVGAASSCHFCGLNRKTIQL